MKCVNLFGSPACGKSTCAANLFAHLKSHHVVTELVGEFAKELIYLGNQVQLVNQVYILGSQYRKQKDLERSGIDIAISDSPLLMQMTYCEDKPYYNEINALALKLNDEFDNINVFINRRFPYQMYGRVTTEAESDILSAKIWERMDGEFHYVIDGNSDGTIALSRDILELADKEILAKF